MTTPPEELPRAKSKRPRFLATPDLGQHGAVALPLGYRVRHHTNRTEGIDVDRHRRDRAVLGAGARTFLSGLEGGDVPGRLFRNNAYCRLAFLSRSDFTTLLINYN